MGFSITTYIIYYCTGCYKAKCRILSPIIPYAIINFSDNLMCKFKVYRYKKNMKFFKNTSGAHYSFYKMITDNDALLKF